MLLRFTTRLTAAAAKHFCGHLNVDEAKGLESARSNIYVVIINARFKIIMTLIRDSEKFRNSLRVETSIKFLLKMHRLDDVL